MLVEEPDHIRIVLGSFFAVINRDELEIRVILEVDSRIRGAAWVPAFIADSETERITEEFFCSLKISHGDSDVVDAAAGAEQGWLTFGLQKIVNDEEPDVNRLSFDFEAA